MTIIFVVSVFLFVCTEFFSTVFDPISIKLGHENPNYDVINDAISVFASCRRAMRFSPLDSSAQRISWGEVVSVFLYLL